MRIGLQIPSFTWPGGPAEIRPRLADIARSAEANGFASLWVMDHFFQIDLVGPAESEMLDGYAALSFLAGVTERATLGTSTLHIFWDLLQVLAGENAAIYVDAGVYPVGRWGVERAAARGVPVRRFAHYDVGELRRKIQGNAREGLRTVVVADARRSGASPTRAKLALRTSR